MVKKDMEGFEIYNSYSDLNLIQEYLIIYIPNS